MRAEGGTWEDRGRGLGQRVGLMRAEGGAWEGRGQDLEGGLGEQRAGLGKAGLPPLKHRDALGWS